MSSGDSGPDVPGSDGYVPVGREGSAEDGSPVGDGAGGAPDGALPWQDESEDSPAGDPGRGQHGQGGDGAPPRRPPRVNPAAVGVDALQWGGPTEDVPAVPDAAVPMAQQPPAAPPGTDAGVPVGGDPGIRTGGDPDATVVSPPPGWGPPAAGPAAQGASGAPGPATYAPPPGGPPGAPYSGGPPSPPPAAPAPPGPGPGAQPFGVPLPALVALSVVSVVVLGVVAVATLGGDGDGDDPEGGSSEAAQARAAELEVDGVVVGSTGVIGTWTGPEWQPRPEGVQPGADLEFSILGVDGDVGTASGEAVEEDCAAQQETTELDVHVPLDGSPPPVAVTGVDDPRPRGVEFFDSSATYEQAAAEVASGQGATTPPTVTQVLRTDFDGDGADEVVVAAEHITDPEGLAPTEGDWSIVFLRRVVGNGAATDVLAASIAGGDGGALERIRVSTVADLNGDGSLELALHGRSASGEWTAVHALNGEAVGDGFSEVLRSGCEG